MVLVAYPDSDSDADAPREERQLSFPGHCENKKRKIEDSDELGQRRAKPPPLPSSLHSQYASNTRASIRDDPSLHGGRQRQVPHLRGRWPTHVYLEWFPSSDEFGRLEGLINWERDNFEPSSPGTTRPEIHSSLQSTLGVRIPLHISLSAPLTLYTSVKDDFGSKLTEKLSTSGIQAFGVRPVSLDWVPNFDKSRFFLVMRLSQPKHDQLNKLLGICNATCKEFNLPLLYQGDDSIGIKNIGAHALNTGLRTSRRSDDRSSVFHISIAWTLLEPSDRAKHGARQAQVQDVGIEEIFFADVKIKIGNSILESTLVSDHATTATVTIA